jgi:hypothetical protein
MFQGVLDGAERRRIGAHYTGEADILELEAELAAAKLLTRGKAQ